jgi:hypothetical protein
MTEPAAPAESATPVAPSAPEATPQAETFTLDYVQKLRDEAAGHRVKAKEAGDAARAEVIKEYEGKMAEKDTAFTELSQTAKADSEMLLKLNAVIAAKIPVDDIADVVTLVQGSDAESISESVARVKSLLGKAPAAVSAVDRTQGTGGGTIPLNGNPVLDMLKNAVGAR